jgi:hypothetical protein
MEHGMIVVLDGYNFIMLLLLDRRRQGAAAIIIIKSRGSRKVVVVIVGIMLLLLGMAVLTTIWGRGQCLHLLLKSCHHCNHNKQHQRILRP